MRTLRFQPLLHGLSVVLLGAGCADPGAPFLYQAVNSQVMPIDSLLLDVNGDAPSDVNAPLYEARERNPVIAPDGGPVTLKEFNAVTGTAAVSCVETGTKVDLHLRGLIPNGVYTIANVTFQSPGSGPMLQNMIGLGTLGTPDGAESTFQASACGEGGISAITPVGSLSMLGSMGQCALIDAVEWQVMGVYHIDGKTYGPSLGPDGTHVEQFAFVFKKPKGPITCGKPGLNVCEPSDR